MTVRVRRKSLMGAGRCLSLAEFTPQLAQTGLRRAAAARFHLPHLALEMVLLRDRPADFVAELLPLGLHERDAANRLGGLHLGAAQLGGQALPGPLVAPRHRLQLLRELPLLLVEIHEVGEVLSQLSPALGVRYRALLHVSQIDDAVEFFHTAAQLIGQIEHYKLNQGRTAERLTDPQLAPLHAPGQVHFTLPRQEQNCSHFTQIYADGVIRIDRLLNLLLGKKKIRLLSRCPIKELGLFLEKNAKG